MGCGKPIEGAAALPCGTVTGPPAQRFTHLCIGCRVTALERDSHPPKPTLDPDSFDEWKRAVDGRLDALSARITRLAGGPN